MLSLYAVLPTSEVLIIEYGPPDTVPRYMLYPTAPFDEFQVRSAVCLVGMAPVPVIDCAAGEFDALLENDKDADVAPLACGVNVTVKGVD